MMNDRTRAFRSVAADTDFIRKTLIVLGIVALALLFWQLTNVFLLAFGAVLVAIIFRAAAEMLVRYLHAPERWSLTLASLMILVIFLGLAALFGTQIRSQFANVVERLPFALDNVTQNLGFGTVSDNLSRMLNSLPVNGLAARIAGLGGAILGGLADFILVVIAGLYIAANPKVYIQGFIKLFPIQLHERVESSLEASGQALKLWLMSQLISMTCVGVLSALAFWLIGLPSPYALGLIAGLIDFIPFLGPIIGALPATLIAFTVSGEAALWTILAVLAIQQIEGNIIFPLIAKSVVTIPAALALFAIMVGGVLFGAPGLILGFPLAVVTYVLVKKLYVRETLGEQTSVPGESETTEALGKEDDQG